MTSQDTVWIILGALILPLGIIVFLIVDNAADSFRNEYTKISRESEIFKKFDYHGENEKKRP